MDRLLYPVTEAGELLGIGRTKVYELLARGELAAVKVGRRRLVPVESITAYRDRLVAGQGAACGSSPSTSTPATPAGEHGTPTSGARLSASERSGPTRRPLPPQQRTW